MKRMFTLAISTMIASLSFAQAPAQKAKASDRQIQKVMSAEKMQQAMEVKTVREAKAQAAQETSGSILRKSVRKPGMAQAQLGSIRTIANAQGSNRVVTPMNQVTSAAPKMVQQAAAETVTVDLTPAMFHVWTSADASAVQTDASPWCDYVLNESTGMPYGNGNVDWLQYADLSDYDALVVVATAGTPRFFLNRATVDGQAAQGLAIDTNVADHFAAYVTKEQNEDNTYTFTLDVAKIVAEQGFAHLNVIKGGNWGNVTVASMVLTKEVSNVVVTKDANGIITSVEGGEPKSYARTAGSVYVVGSTGVSIGAQSGVVTVVEDGEKVYIKDPVCRFAQNSWVEGTKNGNMVIVPAGQPLTYNTNYATTISLRYGVVTADASIQAADNYAENFVFVVDGDTWTLQNTAAYGETDGDAYFMGAMWDDDNTMAGGEASTVLTYDPTYVAPSTDLVVLPADAEFQPWNMNAVAYTSESSTPIMNQPVNVSFYGSDVYVQGVFTAFPTAWIKGTVSGSTITFSKLQYIGNYNGSYDIYFAGTDGEGLTDATATLAADGQSITFTTDILANAAIDRIYYLRWLENVVVSAAPADEPIITDLTAALPYFNSFETEEEVAEAAIYDANGDGKTFTITDDTKYMVKAARYSYSSTSAGNDYVVFPGLTLKAGVAYEVSVDARSNSNTYPERIEVVAGTVAKTSDLTTSVIPATELTTGEYETLTAVFSPEADGVYYFALHAISDPDQFYLYADNFSVKELNFNTPAAPTALEVIADENADLAAEIVVTAPSLTIGGEALPKRVTLSFSRNGEAFYTQTVSAGNTVSVWDEEVPAPGTYTYSVTAIVGDLVSNAVSVKAYVGEDIPDDVENLVATDLNGKVGLSWDAPADGVNGGIIVAENLKYNVYPVEMIEFFGMQFPSINYDEPYMTGLTETNAEVEFDTNAGEQGYTYFGVTAQNTAGESYGEMGSVLTGAPYEMPLHEGLTGQALHYWWGTASDDANYELEGGLYIGEDSSDGDGVGFLFDAETAGWMDLQSGKIALRGADNAGLSFDYKADVAAVLNVSIITPEGETVVKTIETAAAEEFTSVKISLVEFAEQPWVRFIIRAEFAEAGTVSVDNVNVMDFISDNLVLTINAPKTVTAGKSVVVKATVKNEGENAAEGYEVKFYINDNEAAAPLFEIPTLAFYESAEFEYELETSVFDELGDVTVKAEIVYAADLKDADNADETVITIVAPSVTPVATVAAEQTAEGVVVSWTVAENTASETTEDFESYEASTVYTTGESCGPWAAADLSQGSTYSWNNGAWDHMGESYAFGIIDFVAEGLDASFSAVSGTKTAIFMSEVNADSQMGQPADKYMISPELPGIAQTITFQAMPITAQYGAETFEVLASSTDANVASFVKVADLSTDIEAWTEFSAQLPEGTKYFAIHYTSNDIFGLFIDDLKYTVGGANPTGYNVYIDESLVGTADAEATSYTYAEELSVGEHTVSVTAVYGNNESAPVSVDLDVTTGIQNITTSAAVEIYTVDGIRVNNAKELKAGVYVANGKKVVVK